MSSGSAGGVVVANPSSTPEATHATIACAEAGLLKRYHVAFPATAKMERRVSRLPGLISTPILRELRRRELPPSIPPSKTKATATLADLRRVATVRLGRSQKARYRALFRQMSKFDSSVARSLHQGDGAVLGVAGWARETMQRARALSIPAILDCPLGHHEVVVRMMREEARLNPEWAGTLQFHDYPEDRIRAHSEEFASADLLLALSSHAKQNMVDAGIDAARIETTPLGVDLDLFRPHPRSADGTFRVIFVGQVSQRKGLSYLVEGFEKAAVPGSELLLVGEAIGTTDPWHGRPGIRHIPNVPRNELPSHYAEADVFVLPSLAEGFALTALEAMASGLPVIVSTNTFGEDLVDDGIQGYIVPIRDADAIAERVRALAADPDGRATMGEAARARAEQYPWSRYQEQVVDILRGVLAPDRHNSPG